MTRRTSQRGAGSDPASEIVRSVNDLDALGAEMRKGLDVAQRGLGAGLEGHARALGAMKVALGALEHDWDAARAMMVREGQRLERELADARRDGEAMQGTLREVRQENAAMLRENQWLEKEVRRLQDLMDQLRAAGGRKTRASGPRTKPAPRPRTKPASGPRSKPASGPKTSRHVRACVEARDNVERERAATGCLSAAYKRALRKAQLACHPDKCVPCSDDEMDQVTEIMKQLKTGC